MTAPQPMSFASSPADFLSHPVSRLPYVSTSAILRSSLAFFPRAPLSLTTLGMLFDVVAIVALIFMLLRTTYYLRRRAAGRAGPTLATAFIKFWSVTAILLFAAHILNTYLTLLHAIWLANFLRVAILLPLCFGRRLRIAVWAYDTILAPFYDSRAEEIEAALTDLSERGALVNDALRELAKALLDRLAVGGLPAVARLPSEIASETRPSSTPVAATLATHPSEELSHIRFRPGGPDARANAARDNAARRIPMLPSVDLAIEAASAEPPRPAFDESRAMRQRFRERLLRRSSKSAPG